MIRTLRALMPPGSRGRVYGYLTLTMLSVLLRAASAVLLVPFVAALFGDDPHRAVPWLGWLTVATVGGWIIDAAASRLGFTLGFGVLDSSQRDLAERLPQVQLRWFTAENTATTRSAIAATGPELVGMIVYLLTPLLGAMALPAVIALALAATVSVPLGLAALAGVVVLFAAMWASIRLSRNADALADESNTELTERIIEFARTQAALRAARRVAPARSMAGAALDAQHGATMRLLAMQIPGQILFSIASQLALILFAGPFAGLLLGFAALGVQLALEAGGVAISPEGGLVFQVMLYINIGWSLVNLLPMWPLDGGRLFRLGLLQFLRPLWAERVTHATAIVLLGSGAAFGFKSGSTMLGIMALYFLMQNLRVLLGEAQGDIVRGRNPRAKAMLADVQAAYDAGDDQEVVLRGHRLREESNLPESVVRKLFAMLGVSTARLGRHSEALSYLQRAETSPAVVEAAIECLHMLDREQELSRLLASKAFQLLSAERRREILEVVRPDA